MGQQSQQMSLVDHAWLRMDSPENLMVVNSVVWTDEPVDAAALREVLRERMVDPFPRFRQRPEMAHLPFGRAHWVSDDDFDLDRHVLPLALPAPGDTAALQRYVSEQMERPLDAAHPLWEVHVLSGYQGGSAVLFRVHHAVADGMALARVLLSLTDEQPDAGFALPTGTSAPTRGWRHVVGGLLHEGVETVAHPSRLVGLGAAAVRDAARLGHIADLPVKKASLLNEPIGPAKVARWSQPLPLDVVKQVGRSSGCTVNDVLLAALGGAFRTYLLGRGEEPRDVPVMVPVDLRPPDRPLPRELGNDFGFFFVAVPAGVADRHERLAVMHERTQELKGSPEAVVSIGVLAALGASPGPLEDFSVAFFVTKSSGVVTNVPGPQQPVYIAGSKVAGVIGWVPRAGDMSFGVAIFSYDGMVTVGVATDEQVLPDPESLIAAFEAEVLALVTQPA